MKKQNIDEKKYILYRKCRAFLYSILFLIYRIFPIKKNQICFSSFEGGGYCCNPKYIAEEIHNEDLNVKMIWLVKNMNKLFPDYIKPVRDTIFYRVFYLSTSKIWVDNSRQKLGTLKRKNQFYIQTWHGQIGFKAIGRLRGEKFSAIAMLVSEYDAKLIDMWISNSKWSTDVFHRAFYNEPIYEVGSPRLDIFYRTFDSAQLLKKIGLEANYKYVIYAPTFRGGSQETNRKVEYNKNFLDYDQVLNAIENKFGGKWKMLVRLHPQVSLKYAEESCFSINNNVINVSAYDDVYELLLVSEILITDYSSIAFDAVIGKKIVFLYADDFEKYIADRGELLWNENNIPFKLCHNMTELKKEIILFEYDNYAKRMKQLEHQLEIKEDGNASKRIVEIMRKHII